MVRILNFGSLNIDYVFEVDHITQPGETISSHDLSVFPGGKGANQSAALALAGAEVYHAGKIGDDGNFLKETLLKLGCNVDFVIESTDKTGSAMIQLDREGQNAIVLFPGTNYKIEEEQIETVFEMFDEGDFLLLQNEINNNKTIIERAYSKGMRICMNPAPFDKTLLSLPLEKLELLILNEIEACHMLNKERMDEDFEKVAREIKEQFKVKSVLITMGEKGALFLSEEEKEHVLAAENVKVVDTTGAGDTFIGYFFASYMKGKGVRESMERGARAAELCIGRKGAMSSIPSLDELV